MNKEPVAWMDDCSFFTEQPDDMEGVIPLYTHPVKELTLPTTITNSNSYHRKEHFEDEPQAEELHEILQSNTHPVKELTDEEIEQVMVDSGYGEVHKFVNPFDFARAILRKAQEK